MSASKEAHFGYLKELEERRERGLKTSVTEQQRLQHLLDAHNDCVNAFRVATKTLQTTDLAAYEAFLAQLTLSNSSS